MPSCLGKMEAVLQNLESLLIRIDADYITSTGKKVKVTKTDRVKAVANIYEDLSKSSIQHALNAGSRFEMVCTSSDEPHESTFLGWGSLIKVLLNAAESAFNDSKNSKATAKSGHATVKPTYMLCIKRAIKLSMQEGPPGVIRAVVRDFLCFADIMLEQPSLRRATANDLWSCTRDLLKHDDSRALLNHSDIQKWVDNCFMQLTGRGNMFYMSTVASNVAGDVLQSLATSVESSDVLTQSHSDLSPSTMTGNDFGHSYICNHCCLLLVVADNLPKRQASEIHNVAFRTLTLILNNFALDLFDNTALQSIINVSHNSILSCWNDRKTHESAVSLANSLIRIAPNHKKFVSGIRSRIRNDMEGNSNALVLAGKDVKDDYIEGAASCFSFLDALKFASAPNVAEGHIIIWLRVASAIMSGRVLKVGTSVLIDPREVFDQCTRAAEVVSKIITSQNKMRGTSFIEIIFWSCELVNFTSLLASRIFVGGYCSKSPETSTWCSLYQTLRELVSSMIFSGRTPGHSLSVEGLNLDDSIVRSLNFLSRLHLIDHSTLEFPTGAVTSQTLKMPFPLSRLLSSNKHPTYHDVELFRNLVARNGFTDDDGTGLRYRLVEKLVSLCEARQDGASSTPQLLINASATVVGLVRGECGLSESDPEVLRSTSSSSSSLPSVLSLQREMLAFGLSIGSEKISGNGGQLVKQMREQDLLWTSYLNSNALHTDFHDKVVSVFDPAPNIERSLPSLSRHFSISSNISIKLEHDMVSKLREQLKSLNILRPDSKENLMDDEERSEFQDNTRFHNANASEVGLKILLFSCNYLLVGLRHGLVNTAETGTEEANILNQFISFVTQLFSCISNLDLALVSEVYDLIRACVTVCCDFVQAIDDESQRQKWSSRSPWSKAQRALPDFLLKFANKLGDSLLKEVVDMFKANGKIVHVYSRNKLEDTSAAPSRKRSRPTGNSGPARKKNRLAFSDDESQSSGGNGFPGDDDDDVMNDSTGQEHTGSNSEDDFGDFEAQGTQRPTVKGIAKVESRNQKLAVISYLLCTLVTKRSIVAEAILERLETGLKDLSEVERALSPDGFVRPALFSSLVDSGAFSSRQLVWNVLFSIGSTPALIAAGRDIVHFGNHWKKLNQSSYDYVKAHHTGKLSKNIPLPNYLEDSRVVFLTYACKYLNKVRKLGSSRSTEFTSCAQVVRFIVKGMVDLTEYFRLEHALRMPRKTRVAYLKFGSAIITLYNENLFSDANNNSPEESIQLVLNEKVENTRNAIFKLLSVPDAVVRFVAARAISKILSCWEVYPLSEVEKYLGQYLPSKEMCADDSIIFDSRRIAAEGADPESTDIKAKFKLRDDEAQAAVDLDKSFNTFGTTSKSLSTLVVLSEIAAGREDILPLFFKEVKSRIPLQPTLIAPTYTIIVRICVAFGLKSPRRLYKAFSRAILPRLFDSPKDVDNIYSFPAELVLDEDQHRDSAVYDWLRDEVASVLPYILVQEEESLYHTDIFASKLSTDIPTLFKDNVFACMAVYAMQFTPSCNEKGRQLWNAVDIALGGKAETLLKKRRDDIAASLLEMASANFVCRHSSKNRFFDVENDKGFSRDSRSLQPPLYDPLIMAVVINKIHHNSDDDDNLIIPPKKASHGSLFANVYDQETDSPIIEGFSAFQNQCQKSSSLLLRCLVAISKAIDPSLTCQSTFNRLDAYFCVGLLWLMLRFRILVKPANERLMFYQLLSKGFYHNETSSDAAWLLLEVQKELTNGKRLDKKFTIHDSDLTVRPEHREHLAELSTIQEKRMYELLSCVGPVLVSVITSNASLTESPLRNSALCALQRMLVTCERQKLWGAIVCAGAFPGGRHFKEAKKIYEKACDRVEGGRCQKGDDQILLSLKRFHGLYQKRNSQPVASSLACLQNLRHLLTDPNVLEVSLRLHHELWFRSNGSELPTATLIESSIASLINLLRDLYRESRNDASPTSWNQTSSRNLVVQGAGLLKEQVLRAVAEVLNTLGLIRGRSFTFVHADSRRRSIPAKLGGSYESVQDGLFESIFGLVDVLRSGPSVSSDAAMNALITILQTTDGKELIKSKRDKLYPIAYLYGKGSYESTSVATVAYDPCNGERVDLNSLPQFDNPHLWDIHAFMIREEGGHEAWMRRLCAVLSLKCKSSANKALAGVCFASYRFCCDVLPYLLMDTVHDPNPVLSEIILKKVLNQPETPTEILRIFVHALDVMCQIGLGVICNSGFKGCYKYTGSNNIVISYLYMLDISYSEAAKVALRCGASFSAIRYSQLYVDHKVLEGEANLCNNNNDKVASEVRSTLDNRSDPVIDDVKKSALEIAKPWIRRAMMQISEMDGVRAFSPSATLSEYAESMSILDKEWFRSLEALGGVSHFVQAPPLISDINENAKKEGVDLRRGHDTLQATIGIGNLDVATNYWDGMLNKISKNGFSEPKDPSLSNEALIQKMNDLRYAAAWKLEHWETPSVIPVKNGKEAQSNNFYHGFHHALYQMLHFINADRSSEIPQCLSSARSQILHALCDDSAGVSAQTIFESAAQLRVLHVLENTTPNLKNFDNLNVESAGRSLESMPRRGQNQPSPNFSGMFRAPNNSEDRLSRNVDLILGGDFGIDDLDSFSIVPSRDAFTSNILAEDFPVVLMRCLKQPDRVAQAAATSSARILFHGGSGAWSRSSRCLGSPLSSFLEEAPSDHKIAWKLQWCRLRWKASDDAKTRKQALSELVETLCSQLGGKMKDSSKIQGNHEIENRKSLMWSNGGDNSSVSEYLGFLRSEACRLAACWSLEMKTDEPNVLFETYLEPGLSAAKTTGVEKIIGRAHFAIASFADEQISNINAYRLTKKYEEMIKSIKKSEAEVEKLRLLKQETKTMKKKPRRSQLSSGGKGMPNKVVEDIGRYIRLTSKQAQVDRDRLEKLNKSYKEWVVLACQHFAGCLRNGTTHDLRASFRMVALWLDAKEMRDVVTLKLLSEAQNPNSSLGCPVDVPLAKLLALAPQLFSRLNSTDLSDFQKTLVATITLMSGQYPEYCLWQLLALTNADRTCEESLSSLYEGAPEKQNAANAIFERLESQHGESMNEMKKVADAYITLSEISKETKDAQLRNGNVMDIGKFELSRLKQLRHVPVPTVALPMQASKEYSRRIPYIQGFQRKAVVLSGLSAPFLVKCIGSDGLEHSQIVKGRDDLRGDAVMEQMFGIMNSLLERDSEASKRNLYIRTYRIIPLSPFTGIMQCVSNAVNFMELLVDKKQQQSRGKGAKSYTKTSLHDRYRPNDLKHGDIWFRARQEYDAYALSMHKRLNYLKVVWRKFQPVFRYFFVEQWPDAADWFSHQMNYSRSMAVMSMVGFILGLGDRHLSNIMVDQKTAEVVHIDFGIAFERGKLLSQPEHMPFRLTRDLVDGCGVAGVEGVFRRCCEITLSVMRRHKDVLLTVVEVLLHDPMFNWALTPEKVLREQQRRNTGGGGGGGNGKESDEIESSPAGDSESDVEIATEKLGEEDVSREARRALNRILEKLDGLEGTERLSVEAHVTRLVDEAQAFHVIAPVFPGWAPWL